MNRSAIAVLLTLVLAACNVPTLPDATMRSVDQNLGEARATCTLASGKVVLTGFDQYGYNRCAHQFVGTFGGWCQQQGAPIDCAGVPGSTRLNMKWNEEWDRGNATRWSQGPYGAWLDNEIRGEGFSEHFKTQWDASCATGSSAGSDGGPCIWGAFEVLMDHGKDGKSHVWWTKLSPAGFGS